MLLLGLYECLLVLLDFGSTITLLAAHPDIETCVLDSVFAAQPCGGLVCVVVRH